MEIRDIVNNEKFMELRNLLELLNFQCQQMLMNVIKILEIDKLS